MSLDRKSRKKPGRRAGAGPGGPPRKAAPSSQRKPPARPSAAAAAIAVAAEEERRLRQRNRLTLEEDKPAVERCLEELVFGDVEDNEDALLRRLQGSGVREAAVRGAGRAQAGRTVGGEPSGAEPGRPAAPGALRSAGARERGHRWGPDWKSPLGGDLAFPRPRGGVGGSPCAGYPAGALHVCVAQGRREHFFAAQIETLCFFPCGGSIPCLSTLSGFRSYGIIMCVFNSFPSDGLASF